MQYRVLNQGVTGVRKLYPITEDLYSKVNNVDKDHYTSIFLYNEQHKKKLEETASLAGITDVYTDQITFDLDSSGDLQKARLEALTLADRLIDSGIPEDALQLAFSGAKGFSVVVKINQKLSVEEHKAINRALSEGLETSDSTITDANRIFRVIGTRHNKSGLFKFPLSYNQLNGWSIEHIKKQAENMENADPSLHTIISVDLPKSIYDLRIPKKEVQVLAKDLLNVEDLDFTKKPKGFSNCKFSLLEGFYEEGNRSNALMAIAATCRSLGFNKDITYNMLKASNRLQSTRYGTDPMSKKDLWTTIVDQIFKPTWTGGSYTCKKEGWLHDYCQKLGPHKCKHNEDVATIQTQEVFGLFKSYAENFENNVLTTGIKPLDQKCKFLVGTSAGILAPPGVGKTSISLKTTKLFFIILIDLIVKDLSAPSNLIHKLPLYSVNHTSNQDINSIFYSYDMFHSMVYTRLIQKHTGLQQDKIFDMFKHKDPAINKIKETLEKEYKNVNFCFKSGQSPDEIEQTLIDTEQKIGNKIKLIVVDYNELVVASTSDPTQASAQVAQRLRQIANDREVAVITLLQPAKVFSNPADEITTYQGAKGSGAIAQSLTLMLSLSRPGFSPRNPEQDKFICVNALKNRNGALFTIDLGWEGLSGAITELTDDDLYELKCIREKKEIESANSNGMSF